ncbi:MAG: hypothetical protein ACSLFH_17510 [Desulfuromonadales bacterium]
MLKHNAVFLVGLIVFSVLTSFLFIFYGMSIIMAETAAMNIMVFAYVTTSYGLANVAILSIAWSSRNPWSNGASRFIALCYFGVFVMDALNAEMKSPLGVVGILVLFLVLWTNCFAVKYVVERE